MSIYMRNKIRTDPEILASKVDHVAAKNEYQILQSFDFAGLYQGRGGVTRDFMLWLFLSWGIDYRTNNPKKLFERITFWNFVHPISHCASFLKGLFIIFNSICFSFLQENLLLKDKFYLILLMFFFLSFFNWQKLTLNSQFKSSKKDSIFCGFV